MNLNGGIPLEQNENNSIDLQDNLKTDRTFKDESAEKEFQKFYKIDDSEISIKMSKLFQKWIRDKKSDLK